ncbi:hypothetical protein BMS3Abin04_02353 [bacterium BMS3Abin04]|nr:hypothetical protein BMS3Abin04_02353 [bacterium BMS3Abin04]
MAFNKFNCENIKSSLTTAIPGVTNVVSFSKRPDEKQHNCVFDMSPMKIQVKRVYDLAEQADGKRILVDRLWPRGLPKEAAKLDIWAKSIAPSTELRKWYGHDPDKWHEFKFRYFTELRENSSEVDNLLNSIAKETVTLLYGSKEHSFNNAMALKEYLESNAGK